MQRSEKVEEDEGGDSSSLRVETLDSAESEHLGSGEPRLLSSVFGRSSEEKGGEDQPERALVPSLRERAPGGRGA